MKELIIKETKHILRDKRTVMILFGMPIVMMLLFGFAISTDIRNVRTVVVTTPADHATHSIARQIDASPYFRITHRAATPAEAERLISAQKADMAVVFSPQFAAGMAEGTAAIQLMTDAANPNAAIQQAGYAMQTICAAAPQPASIRMLYNPGMRSAYNFVPGIMGMLLMLICAMMTSVSIVREKERGTMEVLLVSPVRPLFVIIAKAVPYLTLSLAIMVCILLLAAFVLHVPVAGSVAAIFGVSLVYIALALSVGLLVSIVARTQLVAMLVSAVVLLLPSILLSGMIYPIESMPDVLQYVSAAIPARWYIAAMRKLMIMGTGISAVATETAVLAAMACAMLALALKKFSIRL